MYKIKLAISPCPNDTYIFGAWINELIEPNNVFIQNVVYADIQELNKLAKTNTMDCIKVSAAFAPELMDDYQILNSGAALGIGCGPLLISKKHVAENDLKHCTIALPGEKTTAHFLFNNAVKACKNKVFLPFDKIEEALLNDKIDAGVIIHENRFTYQNKGLQLVLDLGKIWEVQTNLPIPLGLILVKRSLPFELKNKIQELIQTSIRFANQNPNQLSNYIREHAQEMNAAVCQKHIELYVNEYSLNLGEGKKAIIELFSKTNQNFNPINNIFLNS
jgi:1,4-dihydroxy-6-naphthoate synthase